MGYEPSEIQFSGALMSISSSLKESEEIFRSVVEQSPNGIYLLAPEGIIIEWNQSMEWITELKKAEVIGRPMLEVMFSLFRDEIKNQQMFDRVSNGTRAYIQNGKIARHDISIENVIQCKSGVRRHIEIVLIRVQLENGYLTGGIVQDITARKQAEAALKRRLDEMTSLSAIASMGALAGNLLELLEGTMPIICQALAASVCYIQISSQEAHDHGQICLVCNSKECTPSHEFRNSVVERVETHGECSRLEQPEISGQRTLTGECIAALGAPIVETNALVGLLYVERFLGDPFNLEDETLLKTITGQLSIAITKVRLMEKLEVKVSDRTRQLFTLYEILEIANSSKDLQIITDRSLRKVISVVRCSQGALFLLDDDGQMKLIAFHNLFERDLDEIKIHLANPDETRIAQKADRQLPHQPDFRTIELSDQKQFCFIPLRAHKREMGGVVVPFSDVLELHDEDQALLVSISDQIGAAVETYRLRKKAEEAAVLEERERLSRELHDSVTQLLYSLTLFAKTGSEFAARNDLANAQTRLATINEISQQALKEMRLMIYELRPQVLEQDGFEQAIRRRLESVEEHLGIRTKVEISCGKLPTKLERNLYFIIQEALNNVLKHSKASVVTVALNSENNHIDLLIIDDGVGFFKDVISGKGGVGLTNIQKSIQNINGKLEVKTAPGHGTSIHVTVDY